MLSGRAFSTAITRSSFRLECYYNNNYQRLPSRGLCNTTMTATALELENLQAKVLPLTNSNDIEYWHVFKIFKFIHSFYGHNDGFKSEKYKNIGCI